MSYEMRRLINIMETGNSVLPYEKVLDEGDHVRYQFQTNDGVTYMVYFNDVSGYDDLEPELNAIQVDYTVVNNGIPQAFGNTNKNKDMFLIISTVTNIFREMYSSDTDLVVWEAMPNRSRINYKIFQRLFPGGTLFNMGSHQEISEVGNKSGKYAYSLNPLSKEDVFIGDPV